MTDNNTDLEFHGAELLVDGDGEDDHGRHTDEEEGRSAP